MSTAGEQVTRLMALTPYLRAHPDGVPLSALAAEFGVTPEVMRRDLQTLVMCGLPELLPDDLIDIDLEAFEDDPEGIVRINNADFLPRPTRLGSGETASLLVALDLMAQDAPTETREVIGGLRSKLESAAQEGAMGRAAVLPSPASGSGDRAQLKHTIEGAIAQDRQLLLRHLNAIRDEITERVIDPVAVVAQSSRSYLDAWCHRTDSRRLFRIDRITSLTPLDTARVRSDLPPRAEGEVFEARDRDRVARLRLGPGARWIAGYHPVIASRECSDGSLEVDLHVADPRWLVRLALSAAPEVEVMEPVDYATLVTDAARATLAAYDEDLQT